MGFFDRFRKPAVNRYEYADQPITTRTVDERPYQDQAVVDRPARDNEVVTEHRDNTGWLWLLLLPLFLLLGLGAYSYLANTNGTVTKQPNFLSRLFSKPTDNSNNSSNGLQFGVGGAPATPTPAPSTNNTGSTSSNVTPTSTPVPSSSTTTSGSVQGTSTRQLPGEAPSTGRGE